MDIGAAGPLAGFLVCLPFLAWGYAHTRFIPVPPTGMERVCAYPQARKGRHTRNPASGPAAPMSTRAFGVGMRSQNPVTAPSVPKPRSGSGMK